MGEIQISSCQFSADIPRISEKQGFGESRFRNTLALPEKNMPSDEVPG